MPALLEKKTLKPGDSDLSCEFYTCSSFLKLLENTDVWVRTMEVCKLCGKKQASSKFPSLRISRQVCRITSVKGSIRLKQKSQKSIFFFTLVTVKRKCYSLARDESLRHVILNCLALSYSRPITSALLSLVDLIT